VLLELYKQYKEEWVVELLFDDLLDWLNWAHDRRRLPPLNLITQGSDNITGVDGLRQPDGSMCGVQGGRYEQADNGVVYDCPGSDPVSGQPDGPGCAAIFDTATCKLTAYNVGATSMVMMELDALAELADAIERPEAAALRARSAALKKLVQNLWDEEIGIFASRFASGECPSNLTLCANDKGFIRRISPTSVWPMLAGAATASQAEAMMAGWMQNKTRFCIAPDGDMAGNDPESCYWGLPSISADDPAFPPLGYWRGFVWAPWAQLTYWALDNQAYDAVPIVVQTRKALAKQMTSMMMDVWTRKRHICENFSPHKVGGTDPTDAADCTGTWFYHWGGLAGLLSLLEQRHV
jgi:putative isomerase